MLSKYCCHIISAGRPSEYKKGPDVGSKSARTKRRYKSLLRDQTTLTALWDIQQAQSSQFHSSSPIPSSSLALPSSPLTVPSSPFAVPSSPLAVKLHSVVEYNNDSDVEVINNTVADSESESESKTASNTQSEVNPTELSTPDGESETCHMLADFGAPSSTVSYRSVSLEPHATHQSSPNADGVETHRDNDDAVEEMGEEALWEEEMEERLYGGSEIKDWAALREQIMKDLRRGKKTLSLAQINQLLIIRNFATLRVKGMKRIPASMEIAQQWHEGSTPMHFARRVRALARHYQVFEQLPQETRGGHRASQSLLDDQSVRLAAREWLTSQPVGQITPRLFQQHLNTIIFPALGINLKRPLCERTARRWLVKLGWRLTVLRKGVYMDGHERADVVEYRVKTFLPQMAKYEQRMMHFEGPDLVRVEPVLAAGEKEIVAYFHDESCFHVNDFKSQRW